MQNIQMMGMMQMRVQQNSNRPRRPGGSSDTVYGRGLKAARINAGIKSLLAI